MKRLLPAWSLLTVAAVAFVWLVVTPAPAAAQGAVASGQASSGAGSASSGGSVSSGGSSGGASSSGSTGSASSGGSSSGGSSGGSSGAVSSGGSRSGSSGPSHSGATGGSGYAAPRNSGSTSTTRGGSGSGNRDSASRAPDRDSNGATGARPRDGKPPVGDAVPRGSVPTPPTNRGGPIYPGGYYGGYFDPWWYGPGYTGYYGGYYDPWYGGYPTYSYGGSSSSYQEEGTLRLKIKPREAEVYQDGFFVGLVDDFDGMFQRLHIESGTHRIEVRAPGYEPLVIDVRISPDHTTTYQGELRRIQ